MVVFGDCRACANCGKAAADGGAALQMCSRCLSQAYCDAACQRAHYKQHKAACRSRAGEITFASGRPPQEFIFCGICNSHFMLCGCTGMGHGVNYVFRNLPPPPRGLGRVGLMRRFASIASVCPSMRAFSAMAWHQDEAPGIAASIEARRPQLVQMMEDYVATLPESGMLNGLASAVGGPPLLEQSDGVKCEIVTRECRAALASFVSGDWSTVTRIGVVLIQNAFQASDRSRYQLNDPHLVKIFQSGIAILLTMLEMGYSDHGYRLAMECNRPPFGTEQPVDSVADRGYFIHSANA